MIVTLHTRLSNRHKTMDPNMRIQAFPLKGTHAFEVKGSQLIAAGLHTSARAGQRYVPTRRYFLHKSDIVPVCYDCATFDSNIIDYCPNTDLSYVMRVQKYDEDGWPMFLTKDVIKATKDNACLTFADDLEPHLVTVKPEMVDIHKPKE